MSVRLREYMSCKGYHLPFWYNEPSPQNTNRIGECNMTSNDVLVVIGGQSYRIAGDTLKPAENSFQAEVLKRLDGIEFRLGVLEQEVTFIKHDVAHLQTSVYWALAAIGIFIASLAIPSMIAGIASTFRRKDDDRVNLTISLTDLFAKALKQETSKGE